MIELLAGSKHCGIFEALILLCYFRSGVGAMTAAMLELLWQIGICFLVISEDFLRQEPSRES